MQVTEVRVALAPDHDRPDAEFLASCSITFDDMLVVHGVKVIGTGGGLLVAMPSRAASSRCRSCRSNVPVDSRRCPRCGRPRPCPGASAGKARYDVAHPKTDDARRVIRAAVVDAYLAEVARRRDPDEPRRRPPTPEA